MSKLIEEAAKKPENARFHTGGVTASEWFERRVKNQRIKNRKVSPKPVKVVLDIRSWDPSGAGNVESMPRNGTQLNSCLLRPQAWKKFGCIIKPFLGLVFIAPTTPLRKFRLEAHCTIGPPV